MAHAFVLKDLSFTELVRGFGANLSEDFHIAQRSAYRSLRNYPKILAQQNLHMKAQKGTAKSTLSNFG